ncbi:6198_t:CDS:2, partial [Acaulospora colombiana]
GGDNTLEQAVETQAAEEPADEVEDTSEQESNTADDLRWIKRLTTQCVQKKIDKQIAERLSIMIEDANERVVPLVRMIRKHIETMEAKKEEDRDEGELVKQVKPLLEQAEKILQETYGRIKGADPDNRLANKAKRNTADHRATPEEQRLAEALKVLVEE